MFSIQINGVPVVFSKFFSAADRDAVVEAVRTRGARRVVFIDTPATASLVETAEALKAEGIEVIVRDHHDFPQPKNDREAAIHAAADRLRGVADSAVISTREQDPACSSLIFGGEFAARIPAAGTGYGDCDGYCPGGQHDHLSVATVIVADADLDGLTASMKAAGVFYPELDRDGAVLDGPRSGQTAESLSPLAFVLTRAMSTLPAFDANRPQVSEDAKGKLFADFVAAASGDESARNRLATGVEAFEAGVREAERLAAAAIEVTTGVVLVDAVGAPRHDLATLTQRLEGRAGCRVTVIRKSQGPVAAKHGGVQFSLAVVKQYQQGINLQDCLTPGFVSSPEAGIISNTTFLLHVSESVWNETVLPALKVKLGG